MILSQWNLLKLARETFAPEVDRIAGETGEAMALASARKALRKLSCQSTVLESVRVPKAKGKGKLEIDLLVVSAYGVLALEVKHWGGNLNAQGQTWLQTRRDHDKSLKNPLPLMEEREAALQTWLKQRGLVIPKSRIHSLLVLSNPNVQLGRKLSSLKSIVRLEDLEQQIVARCDAPKKKFWQKRSKGSWDFSGLISLLGQLPTWDELVLHGGRRYWGDILGFKIEQQGKAALQRGDVQFLKVKAPRSFWSLWRAPSMKFKDWDGNVSSVSFAPQAKLILRHAGQQRDEEIDLIHIDTIKLGWKNQRYYDH
ncbi:nuclease-related domain-containing protein [Pseudobacteriovorax antillogorgiicola]|uniref:Nuclease-related domain-containing protein n=1 Tax=Pseudobacteriovorax antillogorgiicola TaxID=1513793 RepID=A0A1Y6BZD5_9BACT|nr:nuclease-related domain-containing protein [Pseudobacteriovorax antillogorgiicola]TCS52452.1 nuclease-like protein [Pseudobacteriovorax antillogorgiicola]SMF28480.1 Nuclease-related domain-containing protein [Pseudobacteriovorax antillogorgiicola]